MSMGKRTRNRQSELWVSAQELPKPPGHPFYQHLNRLLDKHGFDDPTGIVKPNSWKENASASMRPAEGDRAWRPASIFGCCWWATSKA